MSLGSISSHGPGAELFGVGPTEKPARTDLFVCAAALFIPIAKAPLLGQPDVS